MTQKLRHSDDLMHSAHKLTELGNFSIEGIRAIMTKYDLLDHIDTRDALCDLLESETPYDPDDLTIICGLVYFGYVAR